jgi:ATP-binding cassette subfamily B multidrug efflux pump
MGDDGDVNYYLKMVCLDKEVALMENGVDTLIGSSGVRLSGGQAQRLALARTICHKKPVIILDDPFSALDKDTEKQIFKNLGEMVSDSIVMIISHRLYLFPQMNKVLWLNDGKTEVGSHDELIEKCSEYALLYNGQNGGGTGEK